MAHERLAQAPARVGDRRRRREARRPHDAAFVRSHGAGRIGGDVALLAGVLAASLGSSAEAASLALARGALALPLAAVVARRRRSSRGGSRSREPGKAVEPLAAGERRALRRVARKTWRFFDTFVVERGPPPRARQLPGGPGRGRRVAHLADEHRAAAALVPQRLRPRLRHRSRDLVDARVAHARTRWPASSASAATSTTGTTPRRSQPLRPAYVSHRRLRQPRRASARAAHRAARGVRVAAARPAAARGRSRRGAARARGPRRRAGRAPRRDRLARLREALDALGARCSTRRDARPTSASGGCCSSASRHSPTRSRPR